MPEYKVKLSRRYLYEVTVLAESQTEAEENAVDSVGNGEIRSHCVEEAEVDSCEKVSDE